VTEKDLLREFDLYGPIERLRLVTHPDTGASRGYAFIVYERERDMKAAYKDADGLKIKGKRVLIDVERGRTVKGWKPRRLGGGLGGRIKKLKGASRLSSSTSSSLSLSPSMLLTMLFLSSTTHSTSIYLFSTPRPLVLDLAQPRPLDLPPPPSLTSLSRARTPLRRSLSLIDLSLPLTSSRPRATPRSLAHLRQAASPPRILTSLRLSSAAATAAGSAALLAAAGTWAGAAASWAAGAAGSAARRAAEGTWAAAADLPAVGATRRGSLAARLLPADPAEGSVDRRRRARAGTAGTARRAVRRLREEGSRAAGSGTAA